MNADEREKFYDDNIAPDLLRLGKLCQENGLSFVCGVEYAPGQFGRTACLAPGADDGMHKVNNILQGFDVGGVSVVAMTVTTGTAK